MVAGYHLIWTAYGWWLPNDPRGSNSLEIRVEPVADLGAIHHGRKLIQPSGNTIQQFYDNARAVLKHPLLTFHENEFELLASAFAQVIEDRKYICYECDQISFERSITFDRIHSRSAYRRNAGPL